MNPILKRILVIKFYLKRDAIAFVSLIAMYMLYVMVANAETTTKQVTVDNDIWSFLKYIGVLFLGLLTWLAYRFIKNIDDLIKALADVKTEIGIGTKSIENIESDVAEIKKIQERHDQRIYDLERHRN